MIYLNSKRSTIRREGAIAFAYLKVKLARRKIQQEIEKLGLVGILSIDDVLQYGFA